MRRPLAPLAALLLAALVAPPALAAGAAPAPPLAARGDFDAIVAIVWISFMVIGGIVNWLRKQNEESKRRAAEAEARRSGPGSLEEPLASPARSLSDEEAAEVEFEAEREAASGLGSEEEARRRIAAQVGGRDDPRPASPDAFEEFRRRAIEERERARRLAEEEARRRLLEQQAREEEEDDRRSAEAHAAAEASMPLAPSFVVRPVAAPYAPPAFTPVVEPVAPPGAGAAGGGAAPLAAPVGASSPVLPPSVAGRLTEAQRLFVGGEIFGRPRMLRPPPRRRAKARPGKPAA